MSATPLLEVRGASRHFGGLQALRDVSFTQPEGSFYGLIGPNGAGKTTMFNVITGVYPPSAGELRFSGVSLAGLAVHEITRLGISRTFQNIRLFASLTVTEHLYAGLAPVRTGLQLFAPVRRESRERIEHLLHSLDLWERRTDRATALPYAAQRRLEIARALVSQPRLLLLDEPAAGTNQSETEVLARRLEDLKGTGVTTLLIDHDMSFVMGLCQRIVVLNFGQKIAEGAPAEVQRDPQVLSAYLGESEVAGVAVGK